MDEIWEKFNFGDWDKVCVSELAEHSECHAIGAG